MFNICFNWHKLNIESHFPIVTPDVIKFGDLDKHLKKFYHKNRDWLNVYQVFFADILVVYKKNST